MIAVPSELHQIHIFVREVSGIDLGDLNREWRESAEIAARKPDLKTLDAEVTVWFGRNKWESGVRIQESECRQKQNLTCNPQPATSDSLSQESQRPAQDRSSQYETVDGKGHKAPSPHPGEEPRHDRVCDHKGYEESYRQHDPFV
jgi:hypothetical protein